MTRREYLLLAAMWAKEHEVTGSETSDVVCWIYVMLALMRGLEA